MVNQSLLENHDEFVNIYDRNINTVYTLCYLYLKNSADTEDAVQSIFLKLLKSNKTFIDEQHEKAWLIVTTKNYCKDHLKSWWKARRIDIETLKEEGFYEENDLSVELLTKLFNLPEKYRVALYLYYYLGYSVKEISKLIGKKESTIQTHLAKGREKLKIDLGGDYYGG